MTIGQDLGNLTLAILRDLLEAGYIQARDVNFVPGKFTPWNLSVNQIIDRIRHKWDDLGRDPNGWEIVWFISTQEGDLALEERQERNSFQEQVAEKKGNELDEKATENELLHHRTYQTRNEASEDIFVFIEGFYNRRVRSDGETVLTECPWIRGKINAVHAHVVFLFSALWLSFILFAWFWHGRYAKRIDVSGNTIHVLLQNGRELQFPRSSITAVRVGRGYAPKNISIVTSNQLRIRLTSEISDFPDLLEELGYPEKQNKPELTNTFARTRRRAFVGLLLAGIFLIVVLIQVVRKGQPPSTVFYLSFGLSLFVSLIVAWGVYRGSKIQKERERKSPMDLQ
jgi:hypothetical protein